MRGLNRVREARKFDDRHERGAVATIVATLLAGGVIIGMLAVSVDIGNLMYERRQVQNGADATSLALAAECAADESSCGPTQVQDLLGSNAHDDASRFLARPDAPNGVCGRDVDSLPTCSSVDPSTSTASLSELSECPPLPAGLDAGIPYVESYAATQTESGGTELFLPFSRVLVGGASGDAGASACARAAWGLPDGYSASLPITISTCEWMNQTENGTDYVSEGPVGAKPGYDGAGQPAWPDTSKEVTIVLHNPKDADAECSWNGKDFPGGFGWLDGDGACETEVSEDDWVHTDVGKNVPNDCKPEMPGLLHSVVDVPVFDCVINSKDAPVGPPPTSPLGVCDPTDPASGGNNSWYHLAGWAKFYISGYKFPSFNEPSAMSGNLCGSGSSCLMGWFLTGTLADAPSIKPPGSGSDFGVYVVKPAG